MEKELFLKKRLTRSDLAREVMTNRTYITRALRGRGLNFAQFVNSFRALRAIELLADPLYEGSSPEEIAILSGFSSVDTMTRYVKKSAGTTACAVRTRIAGQHGRAFR